MSAIKDTEPRFTLGRTEATSAVEADEEISSLSTAELIDRIDRLRVERRAVILAHNYQIPEIQDLADIVGDSLELSRQAAANEMPLIVFCGVHFMAETAAILSPEKRVLVPDPEAGCSLAAMVTAEQVREWKAEHPDAVVVTYINTDAAVKAEADYCCTSGNAMKVIESIPRDLEILFLPDLFLGYYVQQRSGRRMHLWPGECHVHAGIRPSDVKARLQQYDGAHLLLHPECGCISQCLAGMADGELPEERTFVLGTEGMVRHVRETDVEVHVIGTETGLLHRLQKEDPSKKYVALREDAVCPYMKANTLAKVYRSLRDMEYEIRVPEEIAARARRSIARMLEAV